MSIVRRFRRGKLVTRKLSEILAVVNEYDSKISVTQREWYLTDGIMKQEWDPREVSILYLRNRFGHFTEHNEKNPHVKREYRQRVKNDSILHYVRVDGPGWYDSGEPKGRNLKEYTWVTEKFGSGTALPVAKLVSE